MKNRYFQQPIVAWVFKIKKILKTRNKDFQLSPTPCQYSNIRHVPLYLFLKSQAELFTHLYLKGGKLFTYPLKIITIINKCKENS